MKKAKELYEWVYINNASQAEAAEHFKRNQGYISRAIRRYATKEGLPVPDKRRKFENEL